MRFVKPFNLTNLTKNRVSYVSIISPIRKTTVTNLRIYFSLYSYAITFTLPNKIKINLNLLFINLLSKFMHSFQPLLQKNFQENPSIVLYLLIHKQNQNRLYPINSSKVRELLRCVKQNVSRQSIIKCKSLAAIESMCGSKGVGQAITQFRVLGICVKVARYCLGSQ